MIAVSVITPWIEGAGGLTRALESVRCQDHPGIEHLVLKGGSTDTALGILAASENRGVSWISLPDEGPVHALNQGWRRASGDIIACVHADQALLPGAVSAAATEFERNPDCPAVYGRVAWSAAECEAGQGPPSGPWEFERALGERICRQPAVFWRRSLATRFGVFDERLRFAFDEEYWLRVGSADSPRFIEGPALAVAARPEPGGDPWLEVRALEESLEAALRHAPAHRLVYGRLRKLAGRRAAAEIQISYPDNEFERRLTVPRAAWMLRYAERFEISLDDSILSELDGAH
jgi:hypothetical protein